MTEDTQKAFGTTSLPVQNWPSRMPTCLLYSSSLWSPWTLQLARCVWRCCVHSPPTAHAGTEHVRYATHHIYAALACISKRMSLVNPSVSSGSLYLLESLSGYRFLSIFSFAHSMTWSSSPKSKAMLNPAETAFGNGSRNTTYRSTMEPQI